MLIAFACSITLVPAMLALLNPAGETAPVGFRFLGPLDDFLQRHRIAVVVATIGVVVAASPLSLLLPFDFNPVNLRSPTSPVVVTYHQLQKDPKTSGSDAEILAPSIEQADATAKRLNELPQVSRTITVNNYVPGDQDAKIADLKSASGKLRAATRIRQSSGADRASIRDAAKALSEAAGTQQGSTADTARNVSNLLTRLADADVSMRQKAEAAAISPLRFDLDQLRESLSPQPISMKNLPPDLLRDWVLPDGRARVEALPKGDPNDSNVLKEFATAVLKTDPMATGPAVTYYEGGRTVTTAFIEAAVFAPCGYLNPAFHHPQAVGGRAAHAYSALARRRRHPRDLRARRACPELRQHHRPSLVAGRRRRVQDLLHHGLAGRKDRPVAVGLDPRRRLQRHDQCDRVRKHVGIELSRHVEHGEIDGAGIVVHHGHRPAVPAGADGATPSGQQVRRADDRLF
jgi:hypothetical protein